mmetsp:Transcript_1649/g.3385  ORF Transcript_1649/g.3385 Transcript_1649/m.3385 type:complete len:141 (-) Transcript_1649:33-455(-)
MTAHDSGRPGTANHDFADRSSVFLGNKKGSHSQGRLLRWVGAWLSVCAVIGLTFGVFVGVMIALTDWKAFQQAAELHSLEGLGMQSSMAGLDVAWSLMDAVTNVLPLSSAVGAGTGLFLGIVMSFSSYHAKTYILESVES